MPSKSDRDMTAHQLSALSSLRAAKEVKKATNSVWSVATKAPMFIKKPNPKANKRFHPRTGKEIKPVRSNRLISSQAYLIASSGAAACINAQVEKESKILRIDMEKEKPKVPWLPSYNIGAITLLEQFLCAYAQEAFHYATQIKDGLKSHEKVNAEMMRIGFQRAHANVFGASTPGVRNVAVVPSFLVPKPPTKKGEKAKEDQDYTGEDAGKE